MTEHRDPHFFFQTHPDRIPDQVAHRSSTWIGALLAIEGSFHLRQGLNALGNHDDAELLAATFALQNVVAYALDGEGDLWDQDDMRAAGDPSVQGDPPRVPSHDFAHHDSVVRFRGAE